MNYDSDNEGEMSSMSLIKQSKLALTEDNSSLSVVIIIFFNHIMFLDS